MGGLMLRGKDGGRPIVVKVLCGKVMILDATPSRTIEDFRQEACSKMKKDVERCG